MAKRVKRKTVQRKPQKKRNMAKRKTAVASVASNRKAHWAAYTELQREIDKAWSTLKANVNRKAKPQILIRNKNHLLLLLGECNYMARECTRLARGSHR